MQRSYDTLVRFLDTQDIDYGMLKARINCEDLEASMRTSFPEITWVSARVSGTRLLIHIKENEVLSTIPEKDETPCDIVASQPGVITSTTGRIINDSLECFFIIRVHYQAEVSNDVLNLLTLVE